MKKAVSTAMALSMMVWPYGRERERERFCMRQEATMGFPSQC